MNTKYTFTGQYTHVDDFGLLFYVARWYDPTLSRFAQADTVGAGDRYAYVNNNPVRFTDPTGHHCETSAECENDPEPEEPIVKDPCENWEICLLAAVLMSETNRGTYPDEWMLIIAWTYLNRISLKTQDNLWQAVKGNQSAAKCYYQGCDDKGPIYPGLSDNPSNDDLAKYWSDVYEMGSNGSLSSGWEKSYVNAKSAYESWSTNGTGSSADPTSSMVPGGATDFRAIPPEEFDSFNTAWNSYGPSRPNFKYSYLGPEYISGEGGYVYLFVSNLLYSNMVDLQY